MFGFKKSKMSRERGWMSRFNNMMFFLIDIDFLFLCGLSPQNKNQIFAFLIDYSNNLSCEIFPPSFFVRVRLAFCDSQHCIKQKNSLIGSFGEVSVLWHFKIYVGILLQRFINVLQTFWYRNAPIY